MPISLESNSATMLINQYAHGLAGKPPTPLSLSLSLSLPSPPPRSILRFAVFRSQSRIHNERTTDRSAPEPCSPSHARGEGEWERVHALAATLAFPLPFPLSLSLSLSIVRSFPLPVVHRSTTYFTSISCARQRQPGMYLVFGEIIARSTRLERGLQRDLRSQIVFERRWGNALGC